MLKPHRRREDVFVSFASRIKFDPATKCWNWTGAKRRGYASIKTGTRAFGTRQTVFGHRFSYQIYVGPIQKGMKLDHLCRNLACVNPTHLEIVTQRENVMRGFAPPSINAKKTECHRGHAFKYFKNGTKRYCPACNNYRQTLRKFLQTSRAIEGAK